MARARVPPNQRGLGGSALFLCPARRSAASLVSTHPGSAASMRPPPRLTTQTVSRHCQASPGRKNSPEQSSEPRPWRLLRRIHLLRAPTVCPSPGSAGGSQQRPRPDAAGPQVTVRPTFKAVGHQESSSSTPWGRGALGSIQGLPSISHVTLGKAP